MNRVITFSIVTRVGVRQPTKRGSFSGKSKKFFSSAKCPERFWGPNSRLFSWVTRDGSSEEKRSGSESDSPPSSAEVPYLLSWLSQVNFHK